MKGQLYISKLWNTSKFLFVGIALFVAGQAYFTYKGILNFPFFPFEMYAHPAQASVHKDLTHIVINDSVFNYIALPNWTEVTLINSIQYYNRFQSGNNWAMQIWNKRFGIPVTDFEKLIYHRLIPTDAQMATYPEWLSAMLEERTGRKIQSIYISKKQYQYEQFRLVSTGHETVILDHRR